jgi:hypothetical protein
MANINTQTGSIAYAKYQLRRSILENALEKNLTTEDYEDALEFFGGCAFCGVWDAPRKDHLVPVIGCGDFVRRNVVPACQKCDDSKGRNGYREWMLNSSSRCSLKARGSTDKQIRKQIRLIEKWQAGYTPRTEAQLFGRDYSTYQQILRRMDRLCEEARQMIDRVKSRNAETVARIVRRSKSLKNAETSADRIREFVLSRYIVPGRNRGEKTVTVRAGDVHSQMSLRGQHANVCQAMRGDKFLSAANVKLKSSKGPLAGGNTYFTYQL